MITPPPEGLANFSKFCFLDSLAAVTLPRECAQLGFRVIRSVRSVQRKINRSVRSEVFPAKGIPTAKPLPESHQDVRRSNTPI